MLEARLFYMAGMFIFSTYISGILEVFVLVILEKKRKKIKG